MSVLIKEFADQRTGRDFRGALLASYRVVLQLVLHSLP